MSAVRNIALVGLIVLMACAAEAAWVPIGPFGGDARSLAADPSNPDRMFLGTRTGQVYASANGGRTWTRLTELQAPGNWVVDQLVMDPARSQVIYAAMWSLSDGGGGIFKSTDGGRTWASLSGIEGQSVRALAIAAANPQVLVAGTLEGVFRTEDAGAHWQRISPLDHAEIRNVESVAVDPRNPQIIYAGTWHLPWKTTDGGAHWVSIKKGMVDDSDVFSLAVDPAHPSTVYATACTGIYRTDTAGAEWQKIQGIPNSSRRTHTLVIDPHDPEILYAGTTEGLWRTPDGGRSWARLTSHTWVINGVVLDWREPAHFYIAMDHAGVMETSDGGRTFHSANRGFSERQISRIVTDPEEQDRFYVSLLHDGEFGGVFTTNNRGATWEQLSAGLGGRDVTALLLVMQPARRLLAGTPEGLLEYSPEHLQWQRRGRWGSASSTAANRGPFIRDLYQNRANGPIYAATSAGLFASPDGGTWTRLALNTPEDGVYTGASFGEAGEDLLAATSAGLELSRDNGRSWRAVAMDGQRPLRIQRIVPHPTEAQVVFAATEAGLFRSTDGGLSWERPGRGLPVSPLSDVFLAARNPLQILVAGAAGAFYSLDGGNWYTRLGTTAFDDLPIGVASIRVLDGLHVLAASSQNGLFLHDGRDSALASTSPPAR